MSELESLFSATTPNSGGPDGKLTRRGSVIKSDKVHLVCDSIFCPTCFLYLAILKNMFSLKYLFLLQIELRRAYNCEIMLSKVKIPLSDLMVG